MVHGGRDDDDDYGIAVDADAEVIVTMTTKMLLLVILLLLLLLMLLSMMMMMMMMIKRRTITGLKGHPIYNLNITFNQFWLGWMEYIKYIGEWVGGDIYLCKIKHLTCFISSIFSRKFALNSRAFSLSSYPYIWLI